MNGNAPTIHEALAAAKAGIGAVGKTGRNQQQGYNFRGVDAVVNAAAPELNKHGVIVTPVLQSIDYDTVEVGQKRTPMAHVRVIVTYRFHGPAGDSIDATVPGESMDSGDKAAPKAMSVAYRIALLQALNLPTDDVEPDSQTYERSPRHQSAGDAWEKASPARPKAPDDGWADEAIGLAATLPDKDAARALFKLAVFKANEGEITAEQKERVCALITARVADLDAEQPAGTDPWQDEIDSMTTREDAIALLDKLDQQHKGGVLDSRRHKALKAAIRIKADSLPSAPGEAA